MATLTTINDELMPGARTKINADLVAINAELIAATAAVATKADSAATTAALALKAPLASPAFTVAPTGPTAAPGVNTTQLATTAFVNAAVAAGGGGGGGGAWGSITGTLSAQTDLVAALAAASSSVLPPGWVSVAAYSGAGNARLVTDAGMTAGSAVLTSATAVFVSGDVGKAVCINGAGVAGARLSTTILAFTNSTTVVLAASASTTVSSKYCAFGTDNTTPTQTAMAAATAAVYFPPGNYFFAGSIGVVPANISILGSSFFSPKTHVTTVDAIYTPTNHISPMAGGTTFLLTANAGSGGGTKFISLSDNSSVAGITFYWPNQLASDSTPVAYPWAIYLGQGAASSVKYCEFVNGYQCIYIENTIISLVEEVRGQALFRGIKCEGNYDVTRLRGVHFNATWDTASLGLYQKANSIAFDIGRNDLLIADNCFAFYYGVWMHFYDDPTHNVPGGPTAAWAQIRGGGGDICSKCIHVEQVQAQGIDIDGVHLATNSGTNVNVQIDATNTGSVRIHNSMLYNSLGTFGTVAGTGEVMIDGTYCFGSALTGGVAGSTFGTTGWAVTGTGNFAMRGCTFRTVQTHVTLASSLNRAIITANMASGVFVCTNSMATDAAVVANNTITPGVGGGFNDLFNGTGLLSAHTSDSGQSWELLKTGTTFEITLAGGSCYGPSTGGSEYVANYTPASPDQEATVTAFKGSVTGNPEFGIWLRAFTDTTSPGGYVGRFVDGSGYQFMRLDGGFIFVQIGSNVAGTIANGDLLRFTVSGTGATVTLTLFKNGSQVAQTTDTSGSRILSNGRIGIHLYNPSGSTGDYQITTMTSP